MLTSQYYADGLRASMRPDRATPSSMLAGNEQADGQHAESIFDWRRHA